MGLQDAGDSSQMRARVDSKERASSPVRCCGAYEQAGDVVFARSAPRALSSISKEPSISSCYGGRLGRAEDARTTNQANDLYCRTSSAERQARMRCLILVFH